MTIDKENGFNPKWDMRRVKLVTVARAGCWLDTVYDYNVINDQIEIRRRHIEYTWKFSNDKNYEMVSLDPDVWQEIVNTLESARQFIYDTCIEFGVNEFESHFLTINWTINTLKKFRNKFFKAISEQVNEKEYDRAEYDRTALKEAINMLINKFQSMSIDKNYHWSKEAVDGQLSQFRKEASWDIARELAEDTSAILHTKLML